MSDAHYPEWICHECGCRWGRRPAGPNHLATYHEGTCDICGTITSVTEPRDYGHLTIGWQNEPNQTEELT